MKLTIKWLEGKHACSEAIKEFSAYKDGNDTESITVLETLIKKDKLDWANWLCTRLFTHKQNIAYAIYAAEQVINLFEAKYPDDKRPLKAIEAARAVLKHKTKKNRVAAYAAANAANAAANAANAAAYAAANAAKAAYAAANAAANAANAAAYAAANAANAAYAAAYAAANAANAAYAAAYAAANAANAAYAAANAAANAAYAAANAANAAANAAYAAMKIKIIRYGIKLLRRAK